MPTELADRSLTGPGRFALQSSHQSADKKIMEPTELSTEQCRVLARLRAHRPDALVTLHRTRRGLVVEVRQGRRVELARLERGGNLLRDLPLALAR